MESVTEQFFNIMVGILRNMPKDAIITAGVLADLIDESSHIQEKIQEAEYNEYLSQMENEHLNEQYEDDSHLVVDRYLQETDKEIANRQAEEDYYSFQQEQQEQERLADEQRYQQDHGGSC